MELTWFIRGGLRAKETLPLLQMDTINFLWAAGESNVSGNEKSNKSGQRWKMKSNSYQWNIQEYRRGRVLYKKSVLFPAFANILWLIKAKMVRILHFHSVNTCALVYHMHVIKLHETSTYKQDWFLKMCAKDKC